MRNALRQLQFGVRNEFFGRLKLRPGLPALQPESALQGERAFYRRVLLRAMDSPSDLDFKVVWDIGCRNWSYAQALADFFPDAELIGVEIDGGRRYWNLHRRIDQAQAYARELGEQGRQASVIYSDFQKVRMPSRDDKTLFCFFYPFVSDNPCLSWGLPKQYSDFAALIDHAKSLAPHARILSAHQGEWEAELARGAYLRAGVRVTERVLRASEFQGLWPSPYDAHLFIGNLY